MGDENKLVVPLFLMNSFLWGLVFWMSEDEFFIGFLAGTIVGCTSYLALMVLLFIVAGFSNLMLWVFDR